MVKYLFTLCLFFVLFTCTDRGEVQTNENNVVIYELNNEMVENEIIRYNDTISEHRKMINVSVWSLNDTTCFEIRNVLNASTIIDRASTFFVNTKIGIITVSYVNPTVFFRATEGVRVSEKQSWDILKNYYPEEYKYYLTGEIYPITTGGCIVWKLKFVGNKYISKSTSIER